MKGEDVKRIALFEDLPLEECEEIARLTEEKNLPAGGLLFRESDEGNSLILILGGSVSLTKVNEDGDEKAVATLGTGTYLGEMALLDPGVRSLTATAAEALSYAEIPYKGMLSYLESKPEVAAKFYRKLAVTIAQRLRYLNENFAALKSFLKG